MSKRIRVNYSPLPTEVVSTMGCRTYNGYDINSQESIQKNIEALINNQTLYDEICSGAVKDSRGNICPVTIIMPTLAMEADRDVEKFMLLLDKKINEAKDSLIDRFIDQYIRNNLNDRTFVPEVSYSGLFNTESELPKSFKVVVTKASSSDMKRFIYRNQDDIKYRDYICYTYKGLPRYYRHTGQGNYELITPLGDTYYKEYDANSSIMESAIKEVKKKPFKSVMVQQIKQQFEDALAGLDNTFADIYDNSQVDAPSNSDDTSGIEGQLSALDGVISSLNAPQSQVSMPSSTSSSFDILSPEEEAYFDRGIDFEALNKELQNIDPSETDLDNNKNCANIK